jgi:hypothetical protein
MSRGHRSVSFLGSCAIASLAVVGCSRNEPSAPATTTVVSALNASPKTSDFVIEAQNSVRLQTGGMVVNGGDIGARGTSGPFLADSAAVDALTGVQVQTTHNIIAASVNLGTGAHVGDVQTSHLVTGTGATHGGVSAEWASYPGPEPDRRRVDSVRAAHRQYEYGQHELRGGAYQRLRSN